MASGPISEVIQHLRRAVLLSEGAGMTDGQLLEGFLSRRDEAALAVLVRRHGPMVWGVCRRVLGNHADAEDAFQATFLVLLRKAASIVPREMVAPWLYGVARQTARKARATAARRRLRERQVARLPEPALEPAAANDLQPLLDREVSRLPAKYRAVLVLCDLDGKTRTEAARHLGCPEGTVASRLATARTLLARRLSRRGGVVSLGALAALCGEASASVPAAVVGVTEKVVTGVAAGPAGGAGVIPSRVAALTEGVLRTMLLSKLMRLTAVGLVLALVALGGGLLLGYRAAAQPGQADKPPAAGKKGDAAARKKEAVKKEIKKLEGTWTLVSQEWKGQTTAEEALKNWQLTIKGNMWTMKYPAGMDRRTTQIDPTKDPKTIDLTFTRPGGGKIVSRGIYKLESTTEGDTLTECRVDQRSLARPKEFKTTRKAGILFVWKRAK